MVFGTIPENAFAGRPEDLEKKETRGNAHRLYWIQMSASSLGVLTVAFGAVLTYTAG